MICYHKYISLIVAISLCLTLSAQEYDSISIWNDTEEKAPKVTLTPILPEDCQGRIPAVVVCPGGSYYWLDYETEGIGVAKWLADNGFAAFVLKYRTAGLGDFITGYRWMARGHRHPDMIRDAQRAIQIVREQAEQYSIDQNKVGIMGFSAGGHLALFAGESGDRDYLSGAGIETSVSLAPDFVAAIYPVVTFTNKKYRHRRSVRGALAQLGPSKKDLLDSLSLELNVKTEMPPVFLINCKDDPIVDYHNSELMDSALTVHGVDHKYIQYETGGHGFGASAEKTTEEAIHWKESFIEWFNKRF